MVDFLVNLVNGLSLGSVYAIIALGYTMVYGIAKMLNFAHGDVIMVGAYMAYVSLRSLNMSPIVSVLIAMAVCTVLGITIEKLAYKPLRQATSLSVLITAIGVSYFLQNMAQLIWDPKPVNFPKDFISLPSITLLDGQLPIEGVTLITLAVGIIVMIGLSLFIGKTKIGKAMRAVSEDRGAAELMGIKVNRTISITFAIGSALAAVAGVLLWAKVLKLEPTTGALPGIKAFTAAVLGGIGSIPGAMLGGILLGLIEIFSRAYISTALSDAIVFSLLIVVLLVRPTGLLGKPVREKV